jgi:hypothetical protein
MFDAHNERERTEAVTGRKVGRYCFGFLEAGSLVRVCMVVLLCRDRYLWGGIVDHGSVYRRCGCVDESTGRLLGARCPGLRSPHHGTWYFRPPHVAERSPDMLGGQRGSSGSSSSWARCVMPAGAGSPRRGGDVGRLVRHPAREFTCGPVSCSSAHEVRDRGHRRLPGHPRRPSELKCRESSRAPASSRVARPERTDPHAGEEHQGRRRPGTHRAARHRATRA